ncbi:MAG: hypothetical protein IJO76_05295 [Clostridia bacterium]|nr:hypothetical protein [Clostridia bacterium]
MKAKQFFKIHFLKSTAKRVVQSSIAVLAALSVLIVTLLMTVLPMLHVTASHSLPYTAVVNFDDKMYTSKDAGTAGWTEGAGYGESGNGLKWEPSVSSTRINFTPTNNAADEALVFWMSGEDIAWSSPRTVQIYLHDIDGNRCFHLPEGATYYRISDDGTKETAAVNTNKFVELENGFSGWYIIPFSSLTVTWGPTLADRPLNGGFCNIQLYNEWPAPNTIYLDNIGFTDDMEAFTDSLTDGGSTTTPGDDSTTNPGGDSSTTPGGTTTTPTDSSGSESYTAVVNFDDKMYTSKDAGSAGWTEGDGLGESGKGLKWEPQTSVSKLFFTPTGNAAEEAFVFWMSGEDIPWSSPRDIQLYFFDVDGNRCFHLPAGATYYRVSEAGDKETVAVSLDKFVQLENGFTGWYIIPFSSLTVTWGPALTDRPLNGGFCGIQLYNEWPAPNTIYLDNFGFTDDVDAFFNSLENGDSTTRTDNDSTTESDSDSTTESSSSTTQTSGTATNPPSDSTPYTAVVDFDEKRYTSKDAGTAGWTEGDGFGESGKGLKWEPQTSVSKLFFTPTGNTGEEAFVFWMSGEDIPWSTPRDIQLYLFDVDGNRCFHLPVGSTYYRIDKNGNKETVTVANDKFLQLKNGFTGWYVIPFASLTLTWGPALTDRPLNGGFCGIQLYNEWPAPNTIYLDNFGFTGDMDAFFETYAESDSTTTPDNDSTTQTGDSTTNPNGGTTTQPEGSDDTLEPWPGESEHFRLVVNFDRLKPTKVTPSDNAVVSAIRSDKVSYGTALQWAQDLNDDNTASKVVIDFDNNGTKEDKAIAFWAHTGSESPWFTPHLYESVNGEDCFRLKDGELTYYTVGDDGILESRTMVGRTFRLSTDFSGWVILPYDLFEFFWGSDPAEKMDVEGINSLSLFYNDGFHIDDPLYVDQIGMCSDIEAFIAALCGGGNEDEDENAIFRPAVDFDGRGGRITFPTSDNRAGAGETTAESPSPNGKALRWTRPEADGTMSQIDIMFNPNGRAEDGGFAFWISMADSGIMGTSSFRTFLYDTETGTDCFKLPAGSVYYTIGSDGISNTNVIASDQHVDLPLKFEGWVVIPFSSLVNFWADGGADGELDIPNITSVSLILDNAGFTGGIYLDSLGFVSNVENFLTTYGEIPMEDIPYVTFNDFNTMTDDGSGIGSSLDKNTFVASKNAEVSVTGDWSDDFYGLYIYADKACSVNVANMAEDRAMLSGTGGIAFWLDSPEAVKIQVKAHTKRGVIAYDCGDLRQDLYYLVDYYTGETTAQPVGVDGTMSIPDGFCGFVAISHTAFEGGKNGSLNMADVTDIEFVFSDAVDLYLDSISIFRHPYTYITKGVNGIPDDDLIFAMDATVTVDNEEKCITVPTGMNSTQFRKAIAVRFGYRIVLCDTKYDALFGGVDDMEKIGCIEVYLSADLMTTYTVQVSNAPSDAPERPNDGTANTPDDETSDGSTDDTADTDSDDEPENNNDNESEHNNGENSPNTGDTNPLPALLLLCGAAITAVLFARRRRSVM